MFVLDGQILLVMGIATILKPGKGVSQAGQLINIGDILYTLLNSCVSVNKFKCPVFNPMTRLGHFLVPNVNIEDTKDFDIIFTKVTKW